MRVQLKSEENKEIIRWIEGDKELQPRVGKDEVLGRGSLGKGWYEVLRKIVAEATGNLSSKS